MPSMGNTLCERRCDEEGTDLLIIRPLGEGQGGRKRVKKGKIRSRRNGLFVVWRRERKEESFTGRCDKRERENI